MTSSKAQLPFEYYSVAFCRPHGDDIEYKPQTLGKRRFVSVDKLALNAGCAL